MYLHFIIISFFLIGCVNLKSLNSYSENSLEAIKKYDDINFSFNNVCEKECQFNSNFDEKAIAYRLGNNYKPIQKYSDCNCDKYKKADTAFNKIYFVSVQYLEGLKKLSSEEILNFEYDTLGTALKESELIKIKDEEVDAFNKLVNLTTRFITDSKRRLTVHNAIKEGNKPFKLLLDKLAFAIENPLKLALENEIDLEYNYYKSLAINHNNLSLKEKIEIETDYINKRESLIEKIMLLNEYVKILSSIKEGHQNLYDNKDKIHKKDLALYISSYITKIKEVKTEFENLKTEE